MGFVQKWHDRGGELTFAESSSKELQFMDCLSWAMIFFISLRSWSFFYINGKLFKSYRLIWFLLILACLYFSVDISLESIYKYMSKTTVIGVEKDYMFWNTTIPSVTVCQTENRLNKTLVEHYCKAHGIDDVYLNNCKNFMESLANASYWNLQDIKDFKDVDVGLPLKL